MMKKFLMWKNYGQYTATGAVFDMGRTTQRALQRYENEYPTEFCGDTSIDGNGNGGLMRTFSIAFYQCISCETDDEHLEEFLRPIHIVSKLTHAHEIGLTCCGLFSLTLRELLYFSDKDSSLLDIAESAFRKARSVYSKMGGNFKEIIHNPELFQPPRRLLERKDEELPSEGYVLNTWNLALWSLLTTKNYKDCVLKVINVGGDTDSNAAVAGVLAGVVYGKNSIPEEWIEILKNKDLIEHIVEKLTRKLFGNLKEKQVIDRFEGEFDFLAMKAPVDLVIDGFYYTNVASVFYALGVSEENRGEFSWTNAKQARKLYKKLSHLSETDEAIQKSLYEAVKAKYTQNETYRGKLIKTGDADILYDTTGGHDNVLGRCLCEECVDKKFKNFYGKILMRVRHELSGAVVEEELSTSSVHLQEK